jgi:ribosome-binding protein aMBF1 (putative translation factor)
MAGGKKSMKSATTRKLNAAGWRVGSARDFLSLSDQEAALVEMRVSLSRRLRDRRSECGLSQGEVAAKTGSSQSRVAKMEAADPTVSLDLLIRSLLALGTSPKEIARVIGKT